MGVMDIVVSACLLGVPCRFDGQARPRGAVERLVARPGIRAVRICPESAGRLSRPRPPAERQPDGTVRDRDGRDVSEAFAAGARKCADRVQACAARLAILKAKSPSCGSGRIYDGTFTGRLVPGWGVAAELLRKEGITVVDEEKVAFCEPSVEHPVAIMLGSGMGNLAACVHVVRRIPYSDIEGFPDGAQPVEGHRFEALVGTIEGVPVVVYPGRIHLYQGFSEQEVTALVRHAHRIGCRDVIFSCATGGLDPAIEPGTLGLLADHINLTGRNPLACRTIGSVVETPFVAMGETYSPYLRQFARAAAEEAGIALDEGVYAGLLGPSYETPAEVAMLRALGARYVGMSAVCEVIMARALGMEVMGLTLVTNTAGSADLTHDEVLARAAASSDKAAQVLMGTLRLLGATTR